MYIYIIINYQMGVAFSKSWTTMYNHLGLLYRVLVWKEAALLQIILIFIFNPGWNGKSKINTRKKTKNNTTQGSKIYLYLSIIIL